MNKPHLAIERKHGIDRRAVESDGTAQGACPGCGVYPFVVRAHPPERVNQQTWRAGARCVACNDPVGWVYFEADTIFGAEEDERIFRGRARVYR